MPGPRGTPIAHIDSARAVTYYHYDQVGSTRLLTEARGAATATFTYAPYGALTGVMFVSDVAAGALNEMTLGLSNGIVGVDGSCAGPGYGFGGFFGGVLGPGRIARAGAGGISAVRGVEHRASTPLGRIIADFKRGDGWAPGPAHIEPASARRYQGGISIEEVFERGDRFLVRHRIYDRNEALAHETFRQRLKFGSP